MRKPDLDRLLETAVAKALGVSLPPQRRQMTKKAVQHPIRRAA